MSILMGDRFSKEETSKWKSDDISLRDYFKEAVAEAKKHSAERGKILHCCNIPGNWFKQGKKSGLYDSLTDERINTMPLEELKLELALFIANCYRQR